MRIRSSIPEKLISDRPECNLTVFSDIAKGSVQDEMDGKDHEGGGFHFPADSPNGSVIFLGGMYHGQTNHENHCNLILFDADLCL
jgi:hypothetical protein